MQMPQDIYILLSFPRNVSEKCTPQIQIFYKEKEFHLFLVFNSFILYLAIGYPSFSAFNSEVIAFLEISSHFSTSITKIQ